MLRFTLHRTAPKLAPTLLGMSIGLCVTQTGCRPRDTPVSLGAFGSSSDVGKPARHGKVEYDAAQGSYTVYGGGANIWEPPDAFYFVSQSIEGDHELSAEVAFVRPDGHEFRKAVLMFRQDTSPDSAYVDAALHGNGLVSLQYRTEKGGQTFEHRSPITSPRGLRIARHKDQFTVWVETGDGERVFVGLQGVEMDDPIHAGLGVSAHDDDDLQSATFSNVVLAPVPSERKLPMNTAAPPLSPSKWGSRIAIFDLESRESTVVYEADRLIEAPNWSRDGGSLLVNADGRMYTLPATSNGPVDLRPLALSADYRCNNDHDLSPDGTRLAFSASSPRSERSQVFVSDANGANVKLLTPTAPSYFHGWSPDGEWLAFVAERGDGRYELYRVPAHGGPEERLTHAGGYDDGPDYSPDGKWLYFNSNRSGRWEIWRMPPDGAGPQDEHAQKVTDDGPEDWFPHVSPDGEWIVFLSFPEGTQGHDERIEGMQLRLMRAPADVLAAPQQAEVLTTFFGGQGTINVNSWSPDSKRFAYVIYRPLS